MLLAESLGDRLVCLAAFLLRAVGCGALLAVAQMGLAGGKTLARLAWTARWVGVPSFLALLGMKAFHVQPWYTEVVIPFSASLAFVWLAERASRGFGGVVGGCLIMGAVEDRADELFDIPDSHVHGVAAASCGGAGEDTGLELPVCGVDAVPVLLANVSWSYIERPIMEMRRRMPKPTLPGLPEILPEDAVAVVEG